MQREYCDEQLATAIYTVNRHAKTAPDNKPLYELKRLALEKMILDSRAKKIGLHFVKNPRFSKQQSSVLIQCADYYFHTLPKKDDFASLPHLGHLDDSYRNPQRKMSLNTARNVLKDYLGIKTQQMVKKGTGSSSNPKKKPIINNTSYFYGH
ncbi:YkyB family protein [Viridibacillus sp. FSL R5-0468]|uniref:YkyB family protein n=1 Tax=Viridibacillus sp. FSL R5-0468 TaxID=2921640 RepID=UPI0030FA879A